MDWQELRKELHVQIPAMCLNSGYSGKSPKLLNCENERR